MVRRGSSAARALSLVAAAALALGGCQELTTSNPALNRVVPPQDLYVKADELLVAPGLEGVNAGLIACEDSLAVGDEGVPLTFVACFDGGDSQGVDGLAAALAAHSEVEGVTVLGTYCDEDLTAVAVPLCYVYTQVDGWSEWYAAWAVYAVEGDVAAHLAVVREPPPDYLVRVA